MARKPISDKHAIPEGEAGTPFSDYVVEPQIEHRGRGRSRGFQISHEHRIKIQNSKLVSELLSFFETGKPAKTADQVRVGTALMKKILPDLQSVTIAGDPVNPVMHEHKVDLTVYSKEELMTLRAILGKKAA